MDPILRKKLMVADLVLLTLILGILASRVSSCNNRLCSAIPTQSPTESPTKAPTTESPTESPTKSPTKAPTESPTKSPTNAPTESPTKSPTQAPTTKSPTNTTLILGVLLIVLGTAFALQRFYSTPRPPSIEWLQGVVEEKSPGFGDVAGVQVFEGEESVQPFVPKIHEFPGTKIYRVEKWGRGGTMPPKIRKEATGRQIMSPTSVSPQSVSTQIAQVPSIIEESKTVQLQPTQTIVEKRRVRKAASPKQTVSSSSSSPSVRFTDTIRSVETKYPTYVPPAEEPDIHPVIGAFFGIVNMFGMFLLVGYIIDKIRKARTDRYFDSGQVQKDYDRYILNLNTPVEEILKERDAEILKYKCVDRSCFEAGKSRDPIDFLTRWSVVFGVTGVYSGIIYMALFWMTPRQRQILVLSGIVFVFMCSPFFLVM